jgi:hypothetical protein
MATQAVLEEIPESPWLQKMSVRPKIALIVGLWSTTEKTIGGLNAQSIIELLFDKDEII